MRLLPKKKSTEVARRRPGPREAGRASPYAYYSRQQTIPGGNEQNRARRQPLPRSKKEILHYAGQRFGLVLAIIASLALFISSVQVSMQPRLVIINDTAVYRLHPNSTYEANVTQTLRSSWANSNKITINTATLARTLKTDYPEVADASVALPIIGQRPTVYVQLTKPSLLLVGTDGSASVLDETGRVLAPASQVSNLDSFSLPTVTDESGLTIKPGNLALSKGSVDFITGVLLQLKAAGVGYSRLVLPPSSQELDISIQGQPYLVRFNMHDPSTAREQAGEFLATLHYLQQKGITPTNYIDARLSGRAYYK
jgi:hypothetical protein